MLVYKKITAAILFSIYAFSATAAGELCKLPLLVVHYYDHKEENKTIGLTQFFFMHYCQEDGTDSDAADDNQLPFKSTAVTATVSFVSIAPPSNAEFLHVVILVINHPFGFYINRFLPSQYLDTIWQPPRNC